MTQEKTREEKAAEAVVEEKPKAKRGPATQVRPSKADYYERLFQGGR